MSPLNSGSEESEAVDADCTCKELEEGEVLMGALDPTCPVHSRPA